MTKPLPASYSMGKNFITLKIGHKTGMSAFNFLIQHSTGSTMEVQQEVATAITQEEIKGNQMERKK